MSSKNLIIVESPTKARTLTRFLGEDFQIEATMGHIRDLPERKIGIKTEEDFSPDYQIIPGKEETIKKLRKEAKAADNVYLASDPDREGEAIAWHVEQILLGKVEEPVVAKKGAKKKAEPKSIGPAVVKPEHLKRITFHEITKTAIENAMKHSRAIDFHLVDAQQARRILDRLVGYKLSPLLWFKIRRGLSAGRVQSVAVRLIVEREREIEKFIPIEYWEIFADLKKHLGSAMPEAPIFIGKLVSKNGDKIEIHNQADSDDVVADLQNSEYEVQKIDKKEAKRSPSAPFTTSTLQQQSSLKIGWSAKRTMQVAQALYEKGLITYHRTDSTNLAKEAVEMVRNYINQNYGATYLPSAPRLFKTKDKVAQEAHEAIRPTEVSRLADGGWQKEEERLYSLIWKRFVASQMTEAVFDETKVSTLATGKSNYYVLETAGKILKFAGWLTVYGQEAVSEISEEAKIEDQNQLPELMVGDAIDLIKINPLQKFTQPPPRYTEASLIRTLEEYGIGRPSTYAPTISTIQDRQYVEKEEGKFKPTSLGLAVNDFIVEYFPEIVDYDFTAHMEDDLDQIANGKMEWVPVIREFYTPFNEKLNSVSKVAERVQVETEATDEICPDCGANLVVRLGKFGKFLSCSKFPECKFTKPFVRDAGFPCPKCGSPVVFRKSKKGRPFFGCSAWPKCDYAAWKKPEDEKASKTNTQASENIENNLK